MFATLLGEFWPLSEEPLFQLRGFLLSVIYKVYAMSHFDTDDFHFSSFLWLFMNKPHL